MLASLESICQEIDGRESSHACERAGFRYSDFRFSVNVEAAFQLLISGVRRENWRASGLLAPLPACRGSLRAGTNARYFNFTVMQKLCTCKHLHSFILNILHRHHLALYTSILKNLPHHGRISPYFRKVYLLDMTGSLRYSTDINLLLLLKYTEGPHRSLKIQPTY